VATTSAGAGGGGGRARGSSRLAAKRGARRLTIAAVVAAAIVAGASAGAQPQAIVVENWAGVPVGTRGIPPGWQGHKWGSPKYDFAVVADNGGRALLLKSDNESSSISKEIKVDAKQYPILEWRWKVVALPPKGDARRAETDDEAAQIYVTFPRFPTAVRSRIIGYVWDSNAPAGASFPSAKVGTVTFIVVRSGRAEAGKWITESRNVHEDYKRIYGEEPGETVGAVTLSINSQNTGSRAEALFGEIQFRRP
jgi:hypothetical protein